HTSTVRIIDMKSCREIFQRLRNQSSFNHKRRTTSILRISYISILIIPLYPDCNVLPQLLGVSKPRLLLVIKIVTKHRSRHRKASHLGWHRKNKTFITELIYQEPVFVRSGNNRSVQPGKS